MFCTSKKIPLLAKLEEILRKFLGFEKKIRILNILGIGGGDPDLLLQPPLHLLIRQGQGPHGE